MASIFEAAHKGDITALRSLLDGGSQVNVNVRDETGASVLVVAAREGHAEVVQELLSRGADRHEALAQGLGQDGSPVAAILNDIQTGNGAQHNGEQIYGPIPTDIYGGYQLPDGSIAYGYPGYPPPFQGGMGQPAFYHDPVMFPHPQMQQQYPYSPQNFNGPPPSRPLPNMRNGHGRKPSAVGKYPPPDVAKTIPCRFYPNCRNGDSCIFAHIDSIHPSEAQSPGAIMSPSLPGYAPAPAPPHASFYSGGPYAAHSAPFYPGVIPAGGILYAGQSRGPLPLHYQPQEASQPGQMTSEAPKARPQSSSPQDPLQTVSPSQESSSPASNEVASAEQADEKAPTSRTSPEEKQSDITSPASPKSQQVSELLPATSSDGQDRRRRQSFNSFLHSHAVPFQPSQMAASIQNAAVSIPLGPAATMNGIHGMQHHLGLNGHGNYIGAPHSYAGRGKMRGRGGAAGVGGRGPRERTPCTFFAKNACKYGVECLYPHLLPDGTDARHLLGAGPSGFSIQQGEGASASNSTFRANASHGPSQARRQGPLNKGSDSEQQKANTNGEHAGVGSSASSPAAPASLYAQTKRAAGLPPTPSVEVTGPSHSANTHNIGTDGNVAAQSSADKSVVVNGFVPSKPSATALADAAAADSSSATAPTSGSIASPAQPSAPTLASTSCQQKPQLSTQQPQQQNQQKTPQHPSHQQRKGNASKSTAPQSNGVSFSAKRVPAQRVPSGADFPALGDPSNCGSAQSSSTISPTAGKSPPTASAVNGGESRSSPSTTPGSGASKVNFSAILSAPAPPKKAPGSATASPALNGASEAVASQAGEEEEAWDGVHEAGDGSQQQVNGYSSPSTKGAAPSTNGHAKEVKPPKARPAKGSAGPSGKGWASKSQTGQPAATPKEAEVDEDDFQLVKGRNHNKRSQSAGPASSRGGAPNFASVAKASVAA